MELYPAQTELLTLLKLQEGPIREAKVIWGQRSGKDFTMNALYEELADKEHIVICEKPGLDSDILPNVTELDPTGSLEYALLESTNLGSIVVKEFDWMRIGNPNTFYLQVYSALSEHLEANPHIEHVYLVFLGSLSEEGHTKAIFNNKGIEFVATTWDINPNVPLDSLLVEFQKDKRLAMRDFGSVIL